MILFVQTNGTKTRMAFGADFTEGRIMYADRISGNGDVVKGGKRSDSSLNVVNMETCEILQQDSGCTLPKWCSEPLMVAMKLAEFKNSRRKRK